MSRTNIFFSIILIAALTGLSCFSEPISVNEVFNGVNFVGTSEVQKDASCFSPITDINANSVALVPYCYGNSETGEITTETTWQWWGESRKGVVQLIKHAKSKGLKVMVKPHIWFKHGTFTGDVKFTTDKAWDTFHADFRAYLIEYAHICEENKVELFCIGTELGQIIQNRPEFWDELIKELRTIYSGELTYAGNWDSYMKIPFWKQLDYIGIDAYFPVSDMKTPTSKDVQKGWDKLTPTLKSFSDEHKKSIIFTEFGYRSMDYAADKPWETQRSKGVNLEAQKNCFEGLFNSVWKEDFMSGGFVWKWYPNHKESGGKEDNRFTPQNKPSQEVIITHFNQ